MKRVPLLCLIGIAVFGLHADASNPPQPVQPFSAVFWTRTTLHSRAGNPSTFMQRTVCTRDGAGNVRCEIYRPTKGLQHDTTAPVERVLTSAASPQGLPHLQSSKETIEEEADLGTLQFSGVPATGKRQTFHDANGQRTHTQETWFSTTLGLTVHMESNNAVGDTVVSDLSELHLGKPVSSATQVVPAASPAIPLFNLYRGLFTLIAHMERDRQANDPNHHVNMEEIEDHLRKKINLSASEWQALVDKSVNVDAYTHELSQQARNVAGQDRVSLQQNSLSASALAESRATRHKVQVDFNTHVQGEIDKLKTAVGSEAATRIEAYLQGTLAASMSRMHLSPAQVQALRSHKGEGQ